MTNRFRMFPSVLFGLACSLALIGTAIAGGDAHPRAKVYRVTITNVTKGQVFSPPVLATHRGSVSIFTLGNPASDELALVAEAGDGSDLVALLDSLPQVLQAKATTMPIPPGASLSYVIRGKGSFDRLSIVGMLVNTNDAFVAIDSMRLPHRRGHGRRSPALAYDAGSEGNNEECAFVPGPACPAGSGNARDIAGAEGFVHVHNGVHGIVDGHPSDLEPSAYDWRNPVAHVTVKRIR
jgi:hypothetical protein